MRVTFDVDGVLADSAWSVTHQATLALRIPPTHEIGTSWQLEQAWQGHGDEIVEQARKEIELLFQSDDSVYEYAKPILPWLGVLKRCASEGWLAGCVTRRSPRFEYVTDQWLYAFTGIPVLNEHCGVGACKSALLGGVDVHVEDSLKEVQSILANNAAIRIVLVDQPYNQGFEHERVTRAYDALGGLEALFRLEKELVAV